MAEAAPAGFAEAIAPAAPPPFPPAAAAASTAPASPAAAALRVERAGRNATSSNSFTSIAPSTSASSAPPPSPSPRAASAARATARLAPTHADASLMPPPSMGAWSQARYLRGTVASLRATDGLRLEWRDDSSADTSTRAGRCVVSAAALALATSRAPPFARPFAQVACPSPASAAPPTADGSSLVAAVALPAAAAGAPISSRSLLAAAAPVAAEASAAALPPPPLAAEPSSSPSLSFSFCCFSGASPSPCERRNMAHATAAS
mmetsp:Transcript_18451/g.47175  ORF Transcript_18451/g.47175 Transcript_18451/m.47175 type:complete len:263 (-) Transcript_18451:231-1019(-)